MWRGPCEFRKTKTEANKWCIVREIGLYQGCKTIHMTSITLCDHEITSSQDRLQYNVQFDKNSILRQRLASSKAQVHIRESKNILHQSFQVLTEESIIGCVALPDDRILVADYYRAKTVTIIRWATYT